MWLNEVTRLQDYDMKSKPDEEKTSVELSIFIQDINEINEMNSEFTLILILMTMWTDERLRMEHLVNESSNVKLIRTLNCEKEIWTPVLNVVNEKSSGLASSSFRNNNFCHIHENGTVYNFSRMKLTLSCEMDLHNYPLDKQKCRMEIQSWLLTEDQLELKFADKNPFVVTENFNLMEFSLTGHELNKAVKDYNELGLHSVLIVTFNLKREFGHYLLNYYIPSTIFVIASWTSFWLHPEAGPPRVTLALTTMLTLVTSIKNSVNKLPRIAYIKALDYWHVGCASFILLSLFEFVAVNVLARRGRHLAKQEQKLQDEINGRKRLTRSPSIMTICQEEITGISRSNSVISLNEDFIIDIPQKVKPVSKSQNYLTIPNTKRTIHKAIDDEEFKNYNEIMISVPSQDALQQITKEDKNQEMDEKVQGRKDTLVNITRWIQRNFCSDLREMFRMNPKQLSTTIDRKSRYIFPLLFIIFNILYWSLFL